MRLASLFFLTAVCFAQRVPAPVAPQIFRNLRRPANTANMAEWEAVALDAGGHIATGLSTADFAFESDKSAKIAESEYLDTRSRRTIVFLVDDLSLTPDAIGKVRAAIESFVQTLQPDDRIAILRSASGEGASQQLTGDREALGQALARLHYNPLRGQYASGAARANAFNTGAIGTLRQAVVGLSYLPGHKSVVLFSLGLNDLPVTDLNALVRDARSAAVSIYGIDPSAPDGAPAPAPAPVPPRAGDAPPPVALTSLALTQLDAGGMAAMARRTGGELLGGAGNLAAVLARAMGGPDGYYRIRAQEQPSWTAPPQLTVVRSGFELISARPASEIPTDALAAAPQRQDNLPRATGDPFSTGRIRTRIDPLFYYSPQGSGVEVLIYLDPRDLAFRQGLDGIYHGSASVLAAAYASTSQSVQGHEDKFDIAWTASQYREGLRTGIVAAVNLRLKAGMYQIRAVASDGSSGRLGSASQWLEVPAVESGRLAISGIDLGKAGAPPAGPQPRAKAVGPITEKLTFQSGQPIEYYCELYNAKADHAGLTHAELQIVVFREGRMAVANQPMELTLPVGADPQRISVTGRIALPETLEPGRYLMQFTITEKAVSENAPRVATRFVELELRP
jgi:VWFA-related protein